MNNPSPNTLFFLIFTLTTTTTITSSPQTNYTLFGTSHINQTTITLTQPLTNCTSPPPFPNTGRIFSKHPFHLKEYSLNTPFNSNISFSTHFTFLITPPPVTCLSGEGLAFLISSRTNPLPYSLGSIGLPTSLHADANDPMHAATFFAVEFDTFYDETFDDINDNHVGIDVGSVVSVASVDLSSVGVELKSGKVINAWVEYNGSQKVVRVWVGYRGVKMDDPVLTAPVDLSKRFNGVVYVGFSGSNGRGGSSVYVIKNWEFRTVQESLFPNIEVEEIGSDNCMVCFPDVSREGSGSGSGSGSEMGVSKKVKKHHGDRMGLKLAVGLLSVNLILVVLTVGCVVMYLFLIKKQDPGEARPEQTRIRTFQDNANTMPRRFKYTEVRSATKGFSRNQIIGEGVSAIVYKTDWNVAVKRFKTASFGSQVATEFVKMLGGLQHQNLMKLQGWCWDRNELILVYDYMSNGSLDKMLRMRTVTGENLSFETRLNVLIGVSSALLYLHEEFERLIIHRNVKSSNIMLDLDFVPKLGDFGMEEYYEHSSRTRDVIVPARDMGYLAPEYVYSRVPTVKTDVYSFGVVVLEVATGRPAVDDNGVMVADWVWDLWEEKRLVEAADSNLGGQFDRDDMEMMLMVGLICVHPNYQTRPAMKEVLQMLKGEMMPPDLPEEKPTVMIQSVTTSGRSQEVMVRCGGDDVVTSWGTPTSHFS